MNLNSWEIAFWLSSAVVGGLLAATASYPVGLIGLGFIVMGDVWIFVRIRRGEMGRSDQPAPGWVNWLLGFGIIVLAPGLFAAASAAEWTINALLIFGGFAILMGNLARSRATDEANQPDQTSPK